MKFLMHLNLKGIKHSMEYSELELYQDKFIVVECMTDLIEMYQMKTFYYQKIPGIRDFRYSMSQEKSFLYYENKSVVSFSEYLQGCPTVDEVYRILEQINLIIGSSYNYLLYPENFCLHPSWIRINKEEKELKIELFYIPFKEGCNTQYRSYIKQLVSCISKVFNELNDMEGFYYFVRLLDEFKDESFHVDIMEHLDYFLSGKEKKETHPL